MNTIQTKRVTKRQQRRFTIPEKVASNFRIKGDLSRAEEWRVKVLQGNSGDAKVGAWDQVGYVMISTDSRNIIPIARSDEHHCGYEVLRDIYFRKKLVPKEDYVAVFAFGQNYVWEESAKNTQEAFRRFRQYGGRNSIVQGMNERRYIANMDDFIAGTGSLIIPAGELSPVGKFVVAKLEAIAKGVVGKRKDVFGAAYDFIEWLAQNVFVLRRVLVFADDTFDAWQKEILQTEASEDYERLSRLFFTFNGIKNNFHNRIRMVVREKEGSIFDLADVRDFWGNLDVAMAEFDRLSQV
jgi:hypothetical protein